MRTLLLIRHAEAEPTPPGGTDHERSLSGHGMNQARQIGRLIASGELPVPQSALISDAARARQTWAAAAEAAGLDVPTAELRALYGASPDTLVELIRLTADEVGVLAVVGHAPEIPGLARSVRDARGGAAGVGWPPAGVGVVDLPGSWADFSDADARLVLSRAVE